VSSSGVTVPSSEVSVLVDVESVDTRAVQVFKAGFDLRVAGVGLAISWLVDLSPSPKVGVVCWLEPDLSAEVVVLSGLSFFFSGITGVVGVCSLRWIS